VREKKKKRGQENRITRYPAHSQHEWEKRKERGTKRPFRSGGVGGEGEEGEAARESYGRGRLLVLISARKKGAGREANQHPRGRGGGMGNEKKIIYNQN